MSGGTHQCPPSHPGPPYHCCVGVEECATIRSQRCLVAANCGGSSVLTNGCDEHSACKGVASPEITARQDFTGGVAAEETITAPLLLPSAFFLEVILFPVPPKAQRYPPGPNPTALVCIGVTSPSTNYSSFPTRGLSVGCGGGQACTRQSQLESTWPPVSSTLANEMLAPLGPALPRPASVHG